MRKIQREQRAGRIEAAQRPSSTARKQQTVQRSMQRSSTDSGKCTTRGGTISRANSYYRYALESRRCGALFRALPFHEPPPCYQLQKRQALK